MSQIRFIMLVLYVVFSLACSGSVTQRHIQYDDATTTSKVTIDSSQGAEISSVKDARNEFLTNGLLRQSSREHGLRLIEEKNRHRQLADGETWAEHLRADGNVDSQTCQTLYPVLFRNHRLYSRTVYIKPDNGLDDPFVYELHIPGGAERAIDLPMGRYVCRITANGHHGEVMFHWRDEHEVRRGTYRPTFDVASTPVAEVNGKKYFRDIHIAD